MDTGAQSHLRLKVDVNLSSFMKSFISVHSPMGYVFHIFSVFVFLMMQQG